MRSDVNNFLGIGTLSKKRPSPCHDLDSDSTPLLAVAIAALTWKPPSVQFRWRPLRRSLTEADWASRNFMEIILITNIESISDHENIAKWLYQRSMVWWEWPVAGQSSHGWLMIGWLSISLFFLLNIFALMSLIWARFTAQSDRWVNFDIASSSGRVHLLLFL